MAFNPILVVLEYKLLQLRKLCRGSKHISYRKKPPHIPKESQNENNKNNFFSLTNHYTLG